MLPKRKYQTGSPLKRHGVICSWKAKITSFFSRAGGVRVESKRLAKRRADLGDLRSALIRSLRELPLIKMPKMHSHADAASLRTSVSLAFEKLIIDASYTPYSVSRAQRDKADGCRYYFMPRDLLQDFRDDVVTDNHILMMVDVDYYVDMNKYLALGRPILLYTFVPREVAGHVPNADYHFEGDEVVYQVHGGGSYRHHLWDYSRDVITAHDEFGNLLTYTVEQVALEADETRRIILLNPQVVTSGPIPSRLLSPLTRRTFRDQGLVKSIYQTPDGMNISIARSGSSVCATLPLGLYEAISIRLREAKHPSPGDVERLLHSAKVEDCAVTAPVLFDLLGSVGGGIVTATTVVPAKHFQTLQPLVTEDGKEYASAEAPSLTTSPAVYPTLSYNNEIASIQGRVLSQTNTKQPPPKFSQFAAEFRELLVPIGHRGVPYTISEVIELQNKPLQRGRAAKAMPTLFHTTNFIKTMMKLEAYTAATDPRNISTVSSDHQMRLSGYTYAFKHDVLDKLEWYGPGKTPTEIAQRLTSITAAGAFCRDYSRFDGTISKWLQDLCDQIYKRWTGTKYKAEIHQLLTSEHAHAVTPGGVRYDPGYSRKSGSPLTTDHNTIINAFVSYATLRDAGLDKDKAFARLGLYCGDDGVDYPDEMVVSRAIPVAEVFGLSLKCEIVEPGKPVPYCGRIFCDPRTSMSSFQDPTRTLPKLHSVVVPGKQSLINKCAGYLVTDASTPIIGVWCAKVLELEGDTLVGLRSEDRWRLSMPWPQDDVELIHTTFASTLGLLDVEVREIESLIKSATTLDELPQAVINNDESTAAKIACIIEGFIHPACSFKDASSAETSSPSPESAPAAQSSARAQSDAEDSGATTTAAAASPGPANRKKNRRPRRRPQRRGQAVSEMCVRTT